MFQKRKRTSIKRQRISRKIDKDGKEDSLPKLGRAYNRKSKDYVIDLENSHQDYSIHSLLERINKAKRSLESKRRRHVKEIRSLHSKINSKNSSFKDHSLPRIDTEWRPKRAISLEFVRKGLKEKEKNKSVEKFHGFRAKNNSQILFNHIKNFKEKEKEVKKVQKPKTGFLFQKTKIRKIALDKGDIYSSLPRHVQREFIEKVRGTVKGCVKERRVASLTSFVVNSLFRARYLNKFQLIRSPDSLFIPELNPGKPSSLTFQFSDLKKTLLIEPFYVLCLQRPPNHAGNEISLRPETYNFLNKTSKFFEIFFFSSRGIKPIRKLLNQLNGSGKLINKISPNFFSKRDCSVTSNKKSIKDLFLIKNRHVKDIVFLDYKPESLAFNLSNLVLIPFWSGDLDDRTLERYAAYLESLAKNDDCRPAILKDMDYRTINGMIEANEYTLA